MAPAPAPNQIAVWNPDGDLGYMPAGEFDQGALLQGYRRATPEDVQKFQAEQKYGGFGQGLAAAAEGAVGTLAPGLGPLLLEENGDKAEDQLGRAQAHPFARGVGAVGGAILPTILSGGMAAPEEAAVIGGEAAAGLGARALGAARAASELTAPAMIARAGEAAEGAIGGTSALSRIAAAAANQAVQGAAFAGTDILNRAVLRDPQLTAEQAVSEIGISALFGGALGAGTTAAGQGLSALFGKAAEGLDTIGQRLAHGDKETVKFMAEHRAEFETLEQAVPKVADKIAYSSPETAKFIAQNAGKIAKLEDGFPGLTDVLARADAQTGQKILDNWDKLLKDPQARIEVGAAQGAAVQDTYSAVEDALRTVNREVRPEEIQALASQANQKAAQRQFLDIHDQVFDLAKQMRAEPELYSQTVARELEMAREGMWRDYSAGASPDELFNLLNRTKQVIDENARFGKVVPPELRRTATAVKGLRAEIKEALEDPSVWGKAGDRQAAFNAAQNQYFTARSMLEKTLMQKATTRTGAVVHEVAPTKVNSWVNLMADARGQAKSKVFDDYVTAARKLADEMSASGFEEAPAIKQAIDAAAAKSGEIRERANVTQLVKMLQGHEILSSGPAVPMSSVILREAAMHGAGYVVPGSVTGAVTAAIEKIRSPSIMLGVIGALEKVQRKAAKALDSGIRGAFRTGESAVAAEEGISRAAANEPISLDNYRQRAEQINAHASDAERLAQTVETGLGHVVTSAAPVALQLHQTGQRIAQHLAAQLPKTTRVGPLDPDHVPNATELHKINTHLDVAHDPVGTTLRHLGAGSLTREHLSALDAMYPATGKAIRLAAAHQLAEMIAKKEPVPYRMRLGLSMLLGQPMDKATSWGTVAAVQAAYGAEAAQAPQQPQQAPGKRVRSTVETKFGERTFTGTQGAAERLDRGA